MTSIEVAYPTNILCYEKKLKKLDHEDTNVSIEKPYNKINKSFTTASCDKDIQNV